MTDPQTFAVLLNQALKRQRVRRKELAEQLDRSVATIASWVVGRHAPAAADLDKLHLRRLAKLLDMEPEALIELLERQADKPVGAARAPSARLRPINNVRALRDLFEQLPWLLDVAIPAGSAVRPQAIAERVREHGYDVHESSVRAFVSEGPFESSNVSWDKARGLVTRGTYAITAASIPAPRPEHALTAPSLVSDEVRTLMRRLCARLNEAFARSHELKAPELQALLSEVAAASNAPVDAAGRLFEHLVAHRLIERNAMKNVAPRYVLNPDYALNRSFGLRSVIQEMDFLFEGGLLLPSSTGLVLLIQGDAGTGKSMAALQMSISVALAGGVAFYLTAEEDPSVLKDRMAFAGYLEIAPNVRVHCDRSNESFELQAGTQVPSVLEPENPANGMLIIIAVPEREKFAERAPELLQSVRKAIGALRAKDQRRTISWVWDSLDALGVGADRADRASTVRLFDTVRAHGTIGVLISERHSATLHGHLADIVVDLQYRQHEGKFKERVIELTKVRSQVHTRGQHAFSIVPGLGIRIYPSLQSLLSVWRKRLRPQSAGDALRWQVEGMDLEELLNDDIVEGASVLLSGPPATYKLPLGLSLLASQLSADDERRVMIISLREDPPAIFRIVKNYRQLHPLLDESRQRLNPRVLMLHCPPDYYTASRFCAWVRQSLEQASSVRQPLSCVLFNSLSQLRFNSPLFAEEELFVAGLIELFKKQGLTSLFLGSSIASTSEIEFIFDSILSTDRPDQTRPGASTQARLWVTHSGRGNANRAVHTVTRVAGPQPRFTLQEERESGVPPATS